MNSFTTPPPPPPHFSRASHDTSHNTTNQQPSRSNSFRGCLIFGAGGIVGVILLFVFVTAGFMKLIGSFSSLAAVDAPVDSKASTVGEEFARMREVWFSGTGNVKVVRIPLRGMIMLDDNISGWTRGSSDGANAALRAIRRATLDPEIRGILVELDSGGGGITASDIVYDALMRFKSESPGRKVIAHLGNTAASGAYYIALAADHIIAHPTTVTGSIGVLISSFNARELAAKLGIRDATIKSGENKDIFNPIAERSTEQEELLQDFVDRMQTRFVTIVSERRPNFRKENYGLLDGRIFMADQALELGLIDSIGYRVEAENITAELLEKEGLRFIRYEQSFPLRDLFRSPGFWGAAISEILPNPLQEKLPGWYYK